MLKSWSVMLLASLFRKYGGPMVDLVRKSVCLLDSSGRFLTGCDRTCRS